MEKAKDFQKNIYFIHYAKAFYCIHHNRLRKILRDVNTRPLYLLSAEKSVCRTISNSENWTWNKRLVPNQERSMSRLNIVTLLI